MTKSFVVILHYNTTSYTDALYEMLKPYERDDYELHVLDNGSDKGKESKYTTLKIDTNTYYGGGLDTAMAFFLENQQYDSMIVLNSDLIIHGYNFIRGLRKELFKEEDLVLVSGCVLQPGVSQCHWKAIHNWGSASLRYVPWVDYQCSLLKRKFVEEIKGFGSRFGWVQDVMTGIVCEDNNWKIGVCDWLPVIHFGNGTVKDNLNDPIISRYNVLAEQEMYEYFKERGLWDRFLEQRQKGESYKY